MQTVVNGVPDSLMVINRDYTIALANQAVRDAVSDTALDFLLRGWPIHGVVMTTAMLGAGAASRADAVGDVARHGVPVG